MKTLGLVLVLLSMFSCATPHGAAPPSSHAVTTRWDYWCFDSDGVPRADKLARAGGEGWEMVSAVFRPPVVQNGSSVGGGATWVCFKRPH